MYPVQAAEAAEWAHRRYREALARAEREHLISKPGRTPRANVNARKRVAHPMTVAAAMALLMVVLVVTAN